MANPLHRGVNVIAVPVIHPVQITADVAETVHKVYPGVKGRIVRVVAQNGIHGGSTTPATDLDIIPYKSTTALSAAIAARNSSTDATGTSLYASLTSTASALAIAETDYISCDYDITGGSTPTVDGAGAIFWIALED